MASTRLTGLRGVIRNGLEQMKTLELKCAEALSVYSGKRSVLTRIATQNIVQISIVKLVALHPPRR